MNTLWGEFLGGTSVTKLKEQAHKIKRELDSIHGLLSWLRN